MRPYIKIVEVTGGNYGITVKGTIWGVTSKYLRTHYLDDVVTLTPIPGVAYNTGTNCLNRVTNLDRFVVKKRYVTEIRLNDLEKLIWGINES